jgi:tol-pal system protein YbgF
MLKRLGSILLTVSLCTVLSLEAQKSKQVYELIYQDIQAIKQQLQKLDERVQQNSDDIRALAQQLSEVLSLTQSTRTEIAGFKTEQKNLPAQYQVLLQRFDTIRTELARISEKLIEIQRAAPPPQEAGEQVQTEAEQTPPNPQAVPDTTTEKSAEAETEEKPKTTLPPNLSPQEVYTMARSDYLKGNFQLAIEGFGIYTEHFAESPLVDNAMYWIGECYFSQEKYEEAITQFNELILSHPDGDKIAAAYLKKGFSLAQLERTDEALAVLKLMVSKFPLEEETKIARQKIQELEK